MKLKNDEFVQKQTHSIIVEELVRDEFDYKIPLDYKFYMFGEKIAAIQVIDRPSQKAAEQSQCYFDQDFKIIDIDILPVRKTSFEFVKPSHFNSMRAAAVKLGKELGIFMRIDFYSTKDGFYFGEFTPTPEGGNGYSEKGR